MNDFTREELLEISDYCNAWESGIGMSDFRMNLWHKIRYLFDSYCKHESDRKDYCPGLYDKICAGDEINAVDLNRVKKCIKCHRYFE